MMRIDFMKWGSVGVVGTILVLAVTAYAIVHASLPRRDGRRLRSLSLAGRRAELGVDER